VDIVVDRLRDADDGETSGGELVRQEQGSVSANDHQRVGSNLIERLVCGC
jgi:hypothetical protein